MLSPYSCCINYYICEDLKFIIFIIYAFNTNCVITSCNNFIYNCMSKDLCASFNSINHIGR